MQATVSHVEEIEMEGAAEADDVVRGHEARRVCLGLEASPWQGYGGSFIVKE